MASIINYPGQILPLDRAAALVTRLNNEARELDGAAFYKAYQYKIERVTAKPATAKIGYYEQGEFVGYL